MTPRDHHQSPNTDVMSELLEIINQLQRTAQSVKDREAILRDDAIAYYRVLIPMLVNIRDNMHGATSRLVLNGVKQNAISRRMGGEMLGVHQGTIARWMTEENDPSLEYYPLIFKASGESATEIEKIARYLGRDTTNEDIESGSE